MLSGDNSILQRATEAKQDSEREEAKEQARMDIMAYIADKTAKHQDASLDDTKIQEILNDNKPYVKTANATSFITSRGEYEIPYSELYTANDTHLATTLPVGTYTAGQEVELGGEKFFVLEDQGNMVKLLAKYCLNKEGIAQTNSSATTSTYGRPFSKTGYWPTSSNNLDLQSVEMIEEAENDGDVEVGIPNAVLAAQQYGLAKGISGRLMTIDEADSLAWYGSDLMKKIIFGKWSTEDGIDGAPVDGFLNYWLGSSASGGSKACACFAYGQVEYNMYDEYDGSYYGPGGVRPIVFASES